MRPSRGGHAHATEGTISRFSEETNNAFALRDFDPAYVSSGSRLCENVARYDCTRNVEACGHVQSKKMQKFILRSALRPNQISFLHGLGQNPNDLLIARMSGPAGSGHKAVNAWGRPGRTDRSVGLERQSAQPCTHS